jgi:hypothetical protein
MSRVRVPTVAVEVTAEFIYPTCNVGAWRYDCSGIRTRVDWYVLTYLLHGAQSFLISWPVFAASQEIPRIFMEPESSLPFSQVPATRPYT